MKKGKSLGQELIDAVNEALAEPGSGRVLKPKCNYSYPLDKLTSKSHLNSN